MRKQILFTLMLLFAVTTMMAQQVSTTDAMSRASSFLQGKSPHKAPSKVGATASTQLTLAYTQQRTKDQKVCFYVFNRGSESSAAKGATAAKDAASATDGNGFIIVGGDEAAQEILGYCDHGTFDYNTAPANFKWWLSQYQQQISAAIDYAEANPQAVQAAKAKAARKAATTRNSVEPLIQTQWDQDAPYYNAINADLHSQCPDMADYYFVTGCVATAMAQVMKYYNHPTQGVGSHSRKTTYNKTYNFTQSANFGNTTYDWDNMTNTYGSSSTDVQNAAVATLMYHCGVSVDMDYNTSASGGSSALMSKVASSLINYFKYDKSIRYEQRDYYSDDDWESLLYNELSSSRPIVYGGQATNAGHCFVCDGYDASAAANKFHFNWGWGSYCDGWYAVSGANALKPNGNGIGGAGEGSAYSDGQEIVIGVKPDAGGVGQLHLVAVDKGVFKLTIDEFQQEPSQPYAYNKKSGGTPKAVLSAEVQSLSPIASDFELGVRAYDKNTGMTQYWTSSETHTAIQYGYIREIPVSITLSDIEYNGTYELQTIYRPAGSTDDWQLLSAVIGDELHKVVVNGGKATEAQDITFTLSAPEVEVGRTISVLHNDNYYGGVTYESSDASVATVDDDGVITGVGVGTATITAIGGMGYLNSNLLYNATTVELTVTVVPTVKTTSEVTISQNIIYKGETAAITVTGYEGEASNITFNSNNTPVATVAADGTVTAVGEGTATITVTAPETALCNGINETFEITVSASQIILTADPYFNNDNNPWEDDMVLYIPFNNISSTETTEKIYAKVNYNGDYVTYTLGYNSALPSGYEDIRKVNLNGYRSKMAVDEENTVEFYHDQSCTIPFNIPSITYTYRNTLSYQYTISAAGIGTFILPFNAKLPDGWHAYECTGVSASNVVTFKESESIKRNVPYIITGLAYQAYNFKGPKAIDVFPLLFGDGPLKGTMHENAYEFKANDYILQNGEDGIAFYKFNSGSTWKAASFRAFLQFFNPNGAKSLSISIPGFDDDETTGIATVEKQKARPAGIYSINGIRQQTLQPGLNIIVDEQGNTHKVYIKK